MAITTVAQLSAAMRNTTPVFYSKGSRTGAGGETFHWVSGGYPGAGGYPASVPEACSHLTTGAFPFIQQQSPRKTYLVGLSASMSLNNLNLTVEVHDRLVHTQNFNANIATSQNVNCDLSSFLASENIDERKGDSNYSDVQWWYETRTAHGATASDCTINVTYNDNSTGNLTAFAVASLGANRAIRLTPLIPTADQGKFIRGINTVIYSAATGGGAPGFAVTRYRGSATTEVYLEKADNKMWDAIGLPEIHNNSCLTFFSQFPGSDTGVITGQIHLVYG